MAVCDSSACLGGNRNIFGSRRGPPERALYNLALGEGSWTPVEAAAKAGHGDSLVKWIGYRLHQEFQGGAKEPSEPLWRDLEVAARTIDGGELPALLAAKDVLGTWPVSWDGDALPRLTERAKAGDRKAISLACRVAALPSETMGMLAGFCRDGVRLGMPDAAYALAVMQHARPDDFNGGQESRIAETLGVTKSRKQAIRNYRVAAEGSHPQAQSRLAGLMAAGAGVPRDDSEARRLAVLAADQGSAEGKAVLALLLLQGRGGAADGDRAKDLLTDAARSGNRMAQMTLARLAMDDMDFLGAAKWLALSELSERGDPPAAEMDGLLLEPIQDTRRAIRNLRNARLELTARRQAVELREELARSGEWHLVDGIPQSFPATNPQR